MPIGKEMGGELYTVTTPPNDAVTAAQATTIGFLVGSVRAAYVLGGLGSGFRAKNEAQLSSLCMKGMKGRLSTELLMRDCRDNGITWRCVHFRCK